MESFILYPELEQHIDDILRFHRHSDPQLGASVGTVVGQFIRASLIHGCGQYNDLGRPSLALPSLLEILCKVSAFAQAVFKFFTWLFIVLFLKKFFYTLFLIYL